MFEAWNYYKSRFIQYQIYENCVGREVFFKAAEGNLFIRPIKIFSMQGLEHSILTSGFHKMPFHFYGSVAQLDWGAYPNPPAKKTEWKEYRTQFNLDFDDLICGYKFVLDIDNKDIFAAHAIASQVKTIFDKFRLPYYLIFSGKKGFHFCIDWSDLRLSDSPKGWIEKSKIIAKGIAKEVGFKYGSDIDNIYDARRVLRVPYSVHPGTGNVALPLSDNLFENFEPEFFKLENVLKKVPLKNRGLLKRNGCDKEALQRFVNKFA